MILIPYLTWEWLALCRRGWIVVTVQPAPTESGTHDEWALMFHPGRKV